MDVNGSDRVQFKVLTGIYLLDLTKMWVRTVGGPAEFLTRHHPNIRPKRHRFGHLARYRHLTNVKTKNTVLVMIWRLPALHQRSHPRVRRILQMAFTVHYFHTFHMIFLTSSYLYRIRHNVYKRIFFHPCPRGIKSSDFQLIQSSSCYGKQCAVYATHISSLFLIRPFIFHRTE